MPLPTLAALDVLQATRGQRGCAAARGAATLGLALAQARLLQQEKPREDDVDNVYEGCQGLAEVSGLARLLAKAENLLLAQQSSVALALMSRRWLPARLLHELSRLAVRTWQGQESTKESAKASAKEVFKKEPSTEPLEDCLVLIYTFPTEEIRGDVRKALRSLQEHYVDHLGSEPRLVVFVDAESERLLDRDVRPFTSLQITPAVIPFEELERPMQSYSCERGEDCVSGDAELELQMAAHRGKVNETQYWSPTYLRISRYTAGPLFQHPALDSCRYFLKIDTDFFFTQPLKEDPLRYMKNSGLRLGYWQIHVQGQRQQGYMDAALSFLKD